MLKILLITYLAVKSVCTSKDHHNNKYLITQCDEENRSKVDACVEKLWFAGRRSRKFPESHVQMQEHCKQTPVLIKCVEKFTYRCGTRKQIEFTNLMLNTVKVSDENYCTIPAKYEEFISMSSCGNAIKDKSNGCMDTFLRGLGKATAIEAQMKVPQACCAFHKLKSCILKSARAVGKPICGDKQLHKFEKYLNSVSENIFKFMCSDHKNLSHKCQKSMLIAEKKFKKIFKKTKFSFFWFTYYFFSTFSTMNNV